MSTVSATRDETKSTGTPAIRIKKKPTDAVEEASKALSRSLDSRRSSHSSKKGVPVAVSGLGINTGSAAAAASTSPSGMLSPEAETPQRNGPGPSHLRTTSDVASMLKSTDELRQSGQEMQDEVRRDLMFGP